MVLSEATEISDLNLKLPKQKVYIMGDPTTAMVGHPTTSPVERAEDKIHKENLTYREKAQKNGLPYQTLISTLLHQFASGKIRIIL